jgi:CubicO group peptidase (beta-lactamase class C family)
MSTVAMNKPIPAFDHQDETFASAFSILREAIANRAFPAASVAVTHCGQLVAQKSFGHFTYESIEEDRGAPGLASLARPGSDAVKPTTLFDLASLTQVIATSTAAAILYERGQLELDSPVAVILPQFRADNCGELDPRRRDVTFHMLLAHSSGLPAYEKLYLRAHTREDLLVAAITAALSADPGTRAEYSDIGFIILGAALERITREPLDTFCQREIFGPLAMANTAFNPPAGTRNKIPPTAYDRTFRNKIIQGEVQDENAYALGGVAGHAGLFSTVEDLAIFAHAMLDSQNCHFERTGTKATASPETLRSPGAISSPILRPETLILFTRRESSPSGTSRALGWDTPSSPSQSGKYFGPNSFGHLGYTGTSLWIDPDRQLSITLLTNRTWPDCSNQTIKQVRPAFHDAIVEALNKVR